ncbi:protein artichoke-like [Pieris napi]|uniref:protein artichoke-like n=1 Tax=Pieris napi TaxID=78633 RepID=UPI001FB98B87|nr:protein artichoke-like [Pieris napi]
MAHSFVTMNLLLYMAAFWHLSLATNNCHIDEDTRVDCHYTIICEQYAGSAPNPSCSFEPYVTFIIKNSYLEYLTAGFFGATNFDSRVRKIQAVDNTWAQIEESSIRYFTKTEIADLSNNRIQHVKNYAFKNLLSLKNLNLSRNFIETLPSGSLMAAENRISSLIVVDLSYNRISNITTNAFKYLSNLMELYLNYNNIIYIEDNEFGSLNSLVSLNLKNNKLVSINMTLVNLKLLQDLDLSFNYIKSISDYELNRLTALERLNMSNNLIETLESNCFNQAFNLLSVDFQNNIINSELEIVMFINNHNLSYVNFENNNITKIQDGIFKHSSIAFINLQNNNITAKITENTLKGLENITFLDLSGQRFNDLTENAFSGMKNLLYLNLSSNLINSVHNTTFSSSNIIYNLDLSHNNISDISFLRNSLPNVTILFLNYNNLTKVEQGLFSNHMYLKTLDLSMNNIVSIEPFSLPLKSLQYLYLAGNKLNGPIKKDVFSPAKLLRFLDLNNFNITKIEKQAFINLPVLVRLNVSHNQIEDIDPDNFKTTANMINLDISYNQLSKFELNISSLGGTKALYLNNNKLKVVPSANLTEIIYLDISNNEIDNISFPIFRTFHSLRVLHLSHNSLNSFNNPYTNTLKELSDLSLSHNQIYSLNISYFNNLTSLDISHNCISTINSTFLQNLDLLQSLDISNNNITSILPGTFQKLKVLKLLNVSSNSLKNLRFGTFRGLHAVEVLDLSRNAITEIDVHVFHECIALKRLVIDYNQLKSFNIEQLISISPALDTVSIGGNPIECKEIVRSIRNLIDSNMQKASDNIRIVQVTSVDKIYHEDNVHGIKCGDADYTNSTTKVQEAESQSNISGLSVFVGILVTLLVGALMVLGAYLIYKLKSGNMHSESRLQMRHSMDTSISDFQGNLLN